MSEYIEPALDYQKISTLNNNPRTYFHESYFNENNDNLEKMNYNSNNMLNKTKYILDKQLNHNQENNYINPPLSHSGHSRLLHQFSRTGFRVLSHPQSNCTVGNSGHTTSDTTPHIPHPRGRV